MICTSHPKHCIMDLCCGNNSLSIAFSLSSTCHDLQGHPKHCTMDLCCGNIITLWCIPHKKGVS